MTTDDNGLDVLLQLVREGNYALTEELVTACYQVEKQYQYDRDRDVPLSHLRRLVEAEASRQIDADATGNKT